MSAGDIFGGLEAEIWLDGALVANGVSYGYDESHDDKELPTVFGGSGFKGVVKGGYSVSGKFSCLYGEGGANRAVMIAAARSSTALSLVQYPEGNAAGKPSVTMNVFISSVSQSTAADGVSQQIDCSFRATSVPVVAPCLALSVVAMGSVAAGGAASGYTTPVASGGTSTYALTIVRGVLPEGVSMSTGGVFSGTVDAGANVGTYLFEITVTDSASTPVVKVFACSLIVTA